MADLCQDLLVPRDRPRKGEQARRRLVAVHDWLWWIQDEKPFVVDLLESVELGRIDLLVVAVDVLVG
eukprot:15304335-Alexandrium_andersonii.AAC.1